MGIEQIDEVRMVREDVPDDVFITCVSFEERCVKSLLCGENYKAKSIIIFDYRELGHQKAIPRVKTNRKVMLQTARLRVEDERNIFVIDCSRGDPRDGYYQLLEVARILNLSASSKDLSITVDISVFTKAYLLVLLKALVSTLQRKIRLIYTEPAFYRPERLTLGVSGAADKAANLER